MAWISQSVLKLSALKVTLVRFAKNGLVLREDLSLLYKLKTNYISGQSLAMSCALRLASAAARDTPHTKNQSSTTEGAQTPEPIPGERSGARHTSKCRGTPGRRSAH